MVRMSICVAQWSDSIRRQDQLPLQISQSIHPINREGPDGVFKLHLLCPTPSSLFPRHGSHLTCPGRDNPLRSLGSLHLPGHHCICKVEAIPGTFVDQHLELAS